MMKLKAIWDRIAQFGVSENPELSVTHKKQIVFYNKAMFIGFFATISQIFLVWPFIGWFSLTYLSISIVIGICLYYSSKGYFQISKKVSLFFIYIFGALMTTCLGGAGYFHVGAITIFIFSLIVFDLNKERLEVLLGLAVTILSLLIGELGWFNAPDFSSHPFIGIMKIVNILSFTLMNFIFIMFMIELNVKNEKELFDSLNDKESLLKKLTSKTNELEESKEVLEETIKKRTSRLTSQQNVLEKQNSEKEFLLREVHHRVKNNLQIIVSLINLQRSKFDDKEIEEALTETQNRVLSMSLVHQKMYQTSNFTEIGLDEYLSQLIDNIQNLYPHKSFKNTIEIQDDVSIDIETAIPLGLIMNEIVTNFFKYACHEDYDHCAFKINVTADGDGLVDFQFHDNGPGFPDKIDVEKVDSLGLQLITSLVEQIDGKVKFFNDNGAVYHFTFRKKQV